jgi:hypothetical protein
VQPAGSNSILTATAYRARRSLVPVTGGLFDFTNLLPQLFTSASSTSLIPWSSR